MSEVTYYERDGVERMRVQWVRDTPFGKAVTMYDGPVEIPEDMKDD